MHEVVSSYVCDSSVAMTMTVKKVKRFNVLIPSQTRLIGRRRPNLHIYSPQRQVPIWEIRNRYADILAISTSLVTSHTAQ